MKFKASTLAGIIIGLVAIFGAFLWEGGTVDTLFMLPPMIIVIGGTLAAGAAGSSFEMMAKLPKLFYITISSKDYDFNRIIEQIVDYAQKARKEGILSLENKLDRLDHPYLRKLFQICIDGADPDTLEQIVETEMFHITERHHKNRNLFTKMGGYSPTMGIIGTVMGLISVLASAGEDPNVLIHHIAMAFIATMWGILLANLVWLPISDKLKVLHDDEMQLYKLMMDGVKAVQLGEVPSVIRAKLLTALPMEEQERISKYKMVSFYSQSAESRTTSQGKESGAKSDEREPQDVNINLNRGK